MVGVLKGRPRAAVGLVMSTPPDGNPPVAAAASPTDAALPLPCPSRPAAIAIPTLLPGPIEDLERIESLDALRGVAVCGILFVNIQFFAFPFFETTSNEWDDLSFLDAAARLFVSIFFELKFITLFSLMFGAGLAVQMARAQRAGRGFVGHYSRRLAILLAIGLIHGILLWYGDILASYAVLGFAALLFRNCRNATLVVWAALLALVPLALVVPFAVISPGADWHSDNWVGKFGHGAAAWAAPDDSANPIQTLFRFMDDETRVYTTGTWLEIVLLRALYFTATGVSAFFTLYLWRCLAMFLIGIAVFRAGLFAPTPAHRRRMTRFLPVGLILGLVLESAGEYIRLTRGDVAWAIATHFTCQYFGSAMLALAYAAGVVLLMTCAGGGGILRRLVPFGRMALTNYLGHSIICGIIFYWPGLRLFGAVSNARLIGIVIGILVVQVMFCAWWLRRYRLGPMEWIWRSATYLRLQPMRRGRESTAI